MANKTKFGFGSSSNVEQALLDKKINARDILLLDEDTDNPKIGWVSKDGKPIILTDEKDIISVAKNLPVAKSLCPVDKHTKREYVKDLVKEIMKEIPFAKHKQRRSIWMTAL